MLVLTWMSSNMADGNQQKHPISKIENTIGLPLWIANVNFLSISGQQFFLYEIVKPVLWTCYFC